MKRWLVLLTVIPLLSTARPGAEFAQRSWVDGAYLHRLVRGRKRKPSRGTVIRLGIGMGLTVPELDEVLMAAGHAPFVRFTYGKRQAGGLLTGEALSES